MRCRLLVGRRSQDGDVYNEQILPTAVALRRAQRALVSRPESSRTGAELLSSSRHCVARIVSDVFFSRRGEAWRDSGHGPTTGYRPSIGLVKVLGARTSALAHCVRRGPRGPRGRGSKTLALPHRPAQRPLGGQQGWLVTPCFTSSAAFAFLTDGRTAIISRLDANSTAAGPGSRPPGGPAWPRPEHTARCVGSPPSRRRKVARSLPGRWPWQVQAAPGWRCRCPDERWSGRAGPSRASACLLASGN